MWPKNFMQIETFATVQKSKKTYWDERWEMIKEANRVMARVHLKMIKMMNREDSMEISSVEELVKRKVLQVGDELIFKVKKDVYKYRVMDLYCENINHPNYNDVIFNELAINKVKISELFYGYKLREDTVGYWWPEIEADDFESLTRLVMGLFTMTDQWAAKEKLDEKVFIKDLCTHMITTIDALKKSYPDIFEPERK